MDLADFSLSVTWPPELTQLQPLMGTMCEFLLCPQDLLASNSDKFNLLAKLERAQSRILSLESQVGEVKGPHRPGSLHSLRDPAPPLYFRRVGGSVCEEGQGSKFEEGLGPFVTRVGTLCLKRIRTVCVRRVRTQFMTRTGAPCI